MTTYYIYKSIDKVYFVKATNYENSLLKIIEVCGANTPRYLSKLTISKEESLEVSFI